MNPPSLSRPALGPIRHPQTPLLLRPLPRTTTLPTDSHRPTLRAFSLLRNVEEEVANRDVEAVDAVAVDKAVAVSNAAASEVGDKLVVVAKLLSLKHRKSR